MNNSYKKSNSTHFGKKNLREELEKYLKYWPWFILFVGGAVILAFFYLRYATPMYNATATIVINEENSKNNSGTGTASYADLGLLNGLGTNDIEKEMATLRSRKLMNEVVKALNVNVQFFMEGSVRTVELYDNLPFNFNVLKLDEKVLKEIGGAQITITATDGEKLLITDLKTQKTIKTTLGNPVNLPFADIVVTLNPGIKSFPEIIVNFSDVEKVASHYRQQIIFKQVEENSNVIELSLQDAVAEKAQNILDQLIMEFNRDAIEDKNLIAGNTANFINERLSIINDELEAVETGKEEFKETNRLTDIQAESQMYIQNASDYNKRRQEVGTQLELANAMLDYLSSSSKSDLLPANLGIEENGVNQLIAEYNNLVLERNRILGGSTEKNPVVIKLNSRIDQIKANVNQSLQRMRTNLQIAQDDLNRQSRSIGSRILAVPSQEREYRGIERQQGIKETLYLFLLQKREENSLSLAVVAPKAKIVDRAFSTGTIVSPNSSSIFLGSVILGFFIPFSMIYMKGMLDNKVRRRRDVEYLADDLTFIGELPKIKRKKDLLIGKNDRSILAESFRILITNFQYLFNSKEKNTATNIFVTSTVKGEGKTFTSVNLAITLANTNKKVLLIGTDLRNPKLQTLKAEQNQVLGVSDYLANDDLCLKSLVEKSKLHPNLDILASGSIPPNPSELLRNGKIGKMFLELESSYDYLIVDTAPSMLVADTFIISQYADLTLFILKAGYTEKSLLDFVVDAKRSGSIKNVSLVLNNVELTNLGYGNKYGYGYGEEKKKTFLGI